METDAFNELVVAAQMALAEGDVLEAYEQALVLEQTLSDAIDAAHANDVLTCPCCGRKVADLRLHIRRCPSAPADLSQVPPPPRTLSKTEAVQTEMVSGLKLKVGTAAAKALDTVPGGYDKVELLFGIWSAQQHLAPTAAPVEKFVVKLSAAIGARVTEILRDLEAMRAIEQLKYAGSTLRSVGGSEQQPHVNALASLVNAAVACIRSASHSSAPVAAKHQVISRVHESCVPHATHILQLFLDDRHTTAWLSRARSVSDYSEAAHAQVSPDQEKDMDAADDLLEQLKFVAHMAEAYLRCVCVGLGIGRGDDPSNLRCSLSEKLQEMIALYVQLEHCFLIHNTTKALYMIEKVEVEEGIWAVSIPDDVFYVLNKSLLRAIGTSSELAVSAMLNFVNTRVQNAVIPRLARCARVCTGDCATLTQALGRAAEDESHDADDVEDALAAAFSSLTMPTASPAAPRSSPASGGSGPKSGPRPSMIPVDVLIALNTVALGVEYCEKLIQRARPALAESYPKSFAKLDLSVDELAHMCRTLEALAQKSSTGVAELLVIEQSPAVTRHIRHAKYVLNPDQYEAMMADSTFQTVLTMQVLRGGQCLQLIKSLSRRAAQAVVVAYAAQLATVLELAWRGKQFNELGGLLMNDQVRQTQAALESLQDDGSLMPQFARLYQMAYLLRLEKLADIYLPHPRGVLTNEDMAAVLRCRVDFTSESISALQYGSIPCSTSCIGMPSSGHG